MMYDTTNPLDVKKLELRIRQVIERGQVVEVRVPELKRTHEQNRYLHLILQYFASQTGLTLDYVKRVYYKKECNSDLFVRGRRDMYTECVERYLRSSAELTTEEMTLSIDRFKNWSAQVAEIVLPDAESEDECKAALLEIERNKQYMYENERTNI